MSVSVKPAGSWRTVVQPWIKVGTVQEKAVKVFNKINDVWRENWPLQPGPVGAPIATTVYRNDRIEIDVDWTAPTTGEATAKYIIDVDIGTAATGPFSYSTLVTVNAPATALTLTNVGNGYHTFAGKRVYVKMTAQSAAGRNGLTVSAPPVTVAQLPAPPAPTSYSMDIQICRATHTWTQADTGRRVTGFELQTLFNDNGPAPVKYADTVRSSTYESWNPATVGDGEAQGRLRTYGPGGVSAWKTVVGTMPNPVKVSNYRFLNGKMRCDVSSINPSCVVWYTDRNGPWWNDGERTPAWDHIIIQESANWPRGDGREWMMKIRPNNNQGWTGRDQDLPWLTKIDNPIVMAPTGSNTRRAGAWRSGTSEYQGSSTSGQNTAYFFYGTQWFANFSDNAIGYKVNVSSAQIAIVRELSGGLSSAIRPRLMLHRATNSSGDLTHAGAYDTTALSRGEAAWAALPADWAEMLMQGAHEYRGIGLFHSNNALSGEISAQYMLVKAWGHGAIGGHPVFTVRVYHDG